MASAEAFNWIYDLRLTDQQLEINEFPRVGPLPGTAKIFKKNVPPLPAAAANIRKCFRCGTNFALDHYDDQYTAAGGADQCQYHFYRAEYRKGMN